MMAVLGIVSLLGRTSGTRLLCRSKPDRLPVAGGRAGRISWLRLHALKVLCVLTGCILMASSVSALVVSFDQENPPFMYASNGTATGLYPSIVREAFRRMKEPVAVQALPWKRALAGADAGHWGVGGLYMNEERLWKYDYSEPIFEEVLNVYVLRGKEFPFSGIPDMTGKTVGVMMGWSYGDGFDRAVAEGKVVKIQVNDDRANIGLLLLGRVDAILMAPETWALLRGLDPANRVAALPVPMTVNKTYLSFPKSMDRSALLARFNAEVRAMRQDGVIDRFVREYLR